MSYQGHVLVTTTYVQTHRSAYTGIYACRDTIPYTSRTLSTN